MPIAADLSKQGPHIDPTAPGALPPDRSLWDARQLKAFTSPAMKAFRNGLRYGTSNDIRAAVIDDLSTFYQVPPEECVQRCVHWERWSVEEWESRPRTDRESVADFYAKVESWSYDLLWFAYLQTEGYEYPTSAVVADALPSAVGNARHLDFGSGVGVTSQMFMRLGYESDLADVSDTLLDFARFRLKRRGDEAAFINLKQSKLEHGRYDVITAFDTLTHIPHEDFRSSVAMLHAALRTNGLLITNFDARPPTRENAWHLYADDLELRFCLQRTGFEPIERLGRGFAIYRKVEPAGYAHVARGLRDAVLLRSPLRPAYRRFRWFLQDVRARG